MRPSSLKLLLSVAVLAAALLLLAGGADADADAAKEMNPLPTKLLKPCQNGKLDDTINRKRGT